MRTLFDRLIQRSGWGLGSCVSGPGAGSAGLLRLFVAGVSKGGGFDSGQFRLISTNSDQLNQKLK